MSFRAYPLQGRETAPVFPIENWFLRTAGGLVAAAFHFRVSIGGIEEKRCRIAMALAWGCLYVESQATSSSGTS